MNVYVLTREEDSEGGTVVAVADSIRAAKAAGRRYISRRYDNKVPVAAAADDWLRPTNNTWTKRLDGCDSLLIEKWSLTT